jgi:hypothetical protein
VRDERLHVTHHGHEAAPRGILEEMANHRRLAGSGRSADHGERGAGTPVGRMINESHRILEGLFARIIV